MDVIFLLSPISPQRNSECARLISPSFFLFQIVYRWVPELLCFPNNLQNYFCSREDLISLSEGHNWLILEEENLLGGGGSIRLNTKLSQNLLFLVLRHFKNFVCKTTYSVYKFIHVWGLRASNIFLTKF